MKDVMKARFDEKEKAIDKLYELGLLIYIHIIHTYADLTISKAKGIDGFYKGLLLPRDVVLCERLIDLWTVFHKGIKGGRQMKKPGY